MSYLQTTTSTTTTTLQSNISPNSARRVRTDLKTSQNVYLASSFGPTRSRTTSPINIKLRPQQHNTLPASSSPQQQQLQQSLYLQGRSNTHERLTDCGIKSKQQQQTAKVPSTAAAMQSGRSKRTSCKSSNIPMALTATTSATTVANTRKYLKRSNFILTAAKHVVDDSRILSTSAPHEGSTYLSAHLPARATRLLNRSRMQQHCTLNNDDSDSTKSPLTGRRRTNTTSSRTSTASSTNNNNSNSNNNSANSSLQRKFSHHHHHNHHHHQASSSSSFHQRDTHSSSDDLMLYDKSFRNAMIQDVLQFKKQLLRLRKILQETETLNPFENDNGQLFTSCGLDSKLLDDIDLASLTSSTTDDPIQELADLRRQVVYLQGQVDDRDRTIRLQKNLIEKLEAEKLKAPHAANEITTKECVDTATQTERTRPLTIGTESLSRSKPEYTSYTTYFPAICSDSTTIIQHHQQNPAGCLANNQTRRHTIISTTLTNYNQQLSTPRQTPRRASIAWEKQTPSYKPVKITLIGDPLKHWQSEGNSLNKNKDEEFSKNFINTNLNKQQTLPQQENAHNNIILNSKHHHRLQDIMVANEIKTQNQRSNNQQQHHHLNNNHNHHHHHHNHIQPNIQQLQQQQQSSHQFYKTTSHQHNNLKPTVTIV